MIKNVRSIALKEININMTPEEVKIFGAFSEWPLAPLEGVPTDLIKGIICFDK